MPPSPEPLAPETIIDISHESLMRIWNRLKAWVEDEAESAAHYNRLTQNMSMHARGAAGLMTDPELSLMLEWQQKWRPNQAWADRYHPGFEAAMGFLEESREARDAARRAEEEKKQREIRRTRQVVAVLATAFLVAVGFAIFAAIENSRAKTERRAREQAQALEDAKGKLLAIQEQARRQSEDLNRQLQSALESTQKAEAQAEASNARAIQEADRANRNAALFITAIKAQAVAQLANNEQFEKAEILQIDSDAKKDAATLARDRQEMEAAGAPRQGIEPRCRREIRASGGHHC